ncbi:hypothetical protein KZP23_21620 [Echinicola marina]|uniref:DUF5675 family protein n=1 Tax=Echinicola marina TaxID=2859768 RepID=UPI001CF6A88D|nr:DUF5675 family protein [Echinicola marina]UCS93216.1 hypothetical protein KZP23_21620 [Echinicola marina]
MKLLLKRSYWPTATHGEISLQGKSICQVLEASRAHPSLPCIAEGIYRLGLLYEEMGGWSYGICKLKGKLVSQFSPLKKEEVPSNYICPVSGIEKEGKGSFSRLAFLKLRDRLHELFQSEDEVLLEIYSDVNEGLNLCMGEGSWTEASIW